MEALSGLVGMMMGFVIVLLVIVIAIYIVQGIFLTKLNKLMYGKGTALAWIPIANAYLLGKLTINKVVGWILVIGTFSTMTFTTTLNGVEKTTSILPASISSTVSNIISIAELVLLIYAIIKYFKLKKEGNMSISHSSQQDSFVPPIEQNNAGVGLTSNELVNPVQTLNQVNIESAPIEQTVVNQASSASEPMSMVQPVQVESAPVVEQANLEPVQTMSVQEVPIVSEPVSVTMEQQPVQAGSTLALEQNVVETMDVQEVPVVSAFNQQPIQTESIPVEVIEPVVSSLSQQPAQVEQTPVIESIPVASEPVVTAFNQQPVQVESTPVSQQPVVSDSKPIETIDVPVARDITSQSNNN